MTDDKLNYFVLNWLIEQRHNTDLLDSLAVSSALRQQFDRLSYIHPDELKTMKGVLTDIKINSDLTLSMTNRLLEKRSESQLVEKALLFGATNDLMHKYFGMSAKSCSKIRKQIGEVKFKKWDNLDEELFLKEWKDEVSEPSTPSLDELVKFSEKNAIPISQIWNTVSP